MLVFEGGINARAVEAQNHFVTNLYLWHSSRTGFGHDILHSFMIFLEVYFFIRDLKLVEIFLGHAAIDAPGSGINFHSCGVMHAYIVT